MNWSKLKPFNRSQNKSFEQLCYQIAKIKFKHSGEFWPIDDSGGGDGVEFFLILTSGIEWGWQAKFYDGNARLSYSNRKSKIKESLRKALNEHPKLTRWYLCTNSDLTPTERNWFSQELVNEVPAGRKVKIIHWGDSNVHAFLNQPDYAGLKNSFFNDLELNKKWFNDTFDKFFKTVESKFEEELHTEDTNLRYDYIGPLLANHDLRERLENYLNSLKLYFEDFKNDLNELKTINLKGIEWEVVRESYVKKYETAIPYCDKLIIRLEEILRKISPNDINAVMEMSPVNFINPLLKIKEEAREIESLKKLKFTPDYNIQEHIDKYRLNQAIRLKHGPSSNLSKVIDEIRYIFDHSKTAKLQHLHLLGRGGIGKTHLSVSLAKEFIDQGFPAIFLPAIKFTGTISIESQILDLLDIKSNYSFLELLQTLQILGQIYNCRVPIIIDGINESVDATGGLNKRWAVDLDGIEEQVSRYSNLILLTTCRTSYRDVLWKKNHDGIHTLYGFNDPNDIKLLVDKYFKKYKIKSDLTYLSLRQFSTPLMLRIFCEVKNPNRSEEVQVTLGMDSVYDVFDAFITHCDKTIYTRLINDFGLPPKTEYKKVASNNLPKVAKLLWETNSRSITFDTFWKAIDLDGVNYNISKTKALESEGILIIRDWVQEGEVVGFTYDLLGGFLIADYLIGNNEDLGALILSQDFDKKLLVEDHLQKHPLHEDIFECFAALLPVRTGNYLHQIAPKVEKYSQAHYISISSLFAISSQFIDEKQQQIVTQLFEYGENREWLLQKAEEVFFVSDHPFNMAYWSKELHKLSLVERDILWAESFRHMDDERLWATIDAFELQCRSSKSQSLLEKQRTDLVAIYYMWSLSSTVSQLRDRVTKALYWYARAYWDNFFVLLKQSIKTNDPYIFERMAAVCYGVVLANRYNFHTSRFVDQHLPKIAKFLFNNMFAEGAKYSTTHILTRDYTINTIKVAYTHHPELFTKSERKRLEKPFTNGGIRRWYQSKDKNKEQYREGNSLIDYYFKKEKIRTIVDGDMYNPNDDYKKTLGRIRWRAYQLGYDFKLFEQIDSSIERSKRYNNENRGSTTKYGEKYTLIAYFELAGYMDDKGSLNNNYGLNVTRFSDYDIDPSFFEKSEDIELIKDNLLGASNITIKEWLSDQTIPKIEQYLCIKKLPCYEGDWVMLYGNLDQHNKPIERNLSLHIQGIFVNNNQELIKIVKNKIDFHGKNIPNAESIFADEAPLTDMFEYNKFDRWRFEDKVKNKKIEYKVERLFKNGKQISGIEFKKFKKSIESKYNVLIIETPINSDKIEMFYGRVIRFQDNEDGNQKDDLEELIGKEVTAAGMTTKVVTLVKNKRIVDYNEIKVFNPQKHTPKGLVLAKEIVEEFDLINQPQSSCLYEKNGKVASVYLKMGEGYNNYQKFHFVRKDLLDRFLKKNKLKLIWGITGERQHLPADLDKRNGTGVSPWTRLHDTIEYK